MFGINSIIFFVENPMNGNNIIRIAVLLTCYNRKIKTVECLKSLFEAEDYFAIHSERKLELSLYITDDGCTDGTADGVRAIVGDHRYTIINSDGNAYWAGGMRLAWRAAVVDSIQYDYYLLLNDDTSVKRDCIIELLSTDDFCKSKYKRDGVYSGFVSSSHDEALITYGAKVYKRGLFSSAVDMTPTGTPQLCNMPNANILLVSRGVCEKIGILSDCYIHGAADWDYGLRASKQGIPVLTTSTVCGHCEMDHDNRMEEAIRVKSMSFKERKVYINRPNTKQYHDSLDFFWRHNKIKYFILLVSYYLNLYCPSLYYRLYIKR